MSVAVACMLALAVAGPSRESKAAIARAEEHFLAEEYDQASVAFAEAYALDPDPKFLYARAQAERLHGDCATAVDLYERFLATDPPEPASTEAALNRERCQELLAAERTPPAPPPAVDPPPDASAPTTSAARRDALGLGLVGGGGVLVAVGAGVWGIAIANDREAPESRTENEFLDSKGKARVRQRAGIAVTSIGGALLIAGTVRLLMVHKRRTRNTSAAFTLDPTGAAIVLSGRF
jgi:tetratricopeptide (TPR) repeat protein